MLALHPLPWHKTSPGFQEDCSVNQTPQFYQHQGPSPCGVRTQIKSDHTQSSVYSRRVGENPALIGKYQFVYLCCLHEHEGNMGNNVYSRKLKATFTVIKKQ